MELGLGVLEERGEGSESEDEGGIEDEGGSEGEAGDVERRIARETDLLGKLMGRKKRRLEKRQGIEVVDRRMARETDVLGKLMGRKRRRLEKRPRIEVVDAM